ncbi:MAG TPA: PstS family phosphate ABC transporter substrate-binding protein [Actinomycetota bacterium]|nr:PstS family phosphate ABC transporter substrate-binding protein [Actinomycetota bacterium]
MSAVPRSVRAAALAVTLAMVGVACGGGSGGGDLTGTVSVDGSSTVFPISQAVAEEFNVEQPDVKTSVGVSGTGGGFKKFCSGETDMSNASRHIKDSEIAECKKNGIEYLEMTVAIDGLSVLVNPKNTWAKCLTTEELKKIWSPEAQGKITNWRQIRPEFPDKPLKLYGPGTDSGTFDYFTDAIVGEEGKSRSDYTASEDDNVLVQGIAGDENALGYFGFAYYEENVEKLSIVQVDPGSGCVEPSRQTINDGTYKPLSRPLFVYVAKKAAARPEVEAFVDFYLENVNELVESVGYIDMPAAMLAEQKSKWEAFKA